MTTTATDAEQERCCIQCGTELAGPFCYCCGAASGDGTRPLEGRGKVNVVPAGASAWDWTRRMVVRVAGVSRMSLADAVKVISAMAIGVLAWSMPRFAILLAAGYFIVAVYRFREPESEPATHDVVDRRPT